MLGAFQKCYQLFNHPDSPWYLKMQVVCIYISWLKSFFWTDISNTKAGLLDIVDILVQPQLVSTLNQMTTVLLKESGQRSRKSEVVCLEMYRKRIIRFTDSQPHRLTRCNRITLRIEIFRQKTRQDWIGMNSNPDKQKPEPLRMLE